MQKSLIFTPLFCNSLKLNAQKYLKIDARHWAGEDGEILLIEEVIYHTLCR